MRLKIPLLSYRQKVNSKLLIYHTASIIHLTSSHHVGILSSHIITRNVTRGRANLDPDYREPDSIPGSPGSRPGLQAVALNHCATRAAPIIS
ncbi:unnamed protein product [Nyctereutes procyonoides]|uniref:(raccoon dog) hypothetical protein n=1 Tax=Nyctereutes procyonoides TaxID=34880 RepID=A0A811Y4T6_NYCPR|nr:unnamed protein product [Nyctereutes procyonoides]